MAKVKRVKMRHEPLSKQRQTDVTVEVREDQVPIHEKSGWEVVKPATRAATKQTAAKQEA